MFTGLIETTGTIRRITPVHEGLRLTIACNLRDYVIGESIAVNGICLTVVAFDGNGFEADASSETVARTNLATLRSGNAVHLERALRMGDRLGGHWVTGHIDGTGRIARVTTHGSALCLTIETDAQILRYIVQKGSVALDGASLTVNTVTNRDFSIMMIPHTQTVLNPEFSRVGHIVNIETDILGKYVEKLLACNNTKQSVIERPNSSLTVDKLRDAGFMS